jgi:hypothetical protein
VQWKSGSVKAVPGTSDFIALPQYYRLMTTEDGNEVFQPCDRDEVPEKLKEVSQPPSCTIVLVVLMTQVVAIIMTMVVVVVVVVVGMMVVRKMKTMMMMRLLLPPLITVN